MPHRNAALETRNEDKKSPQMEEGGSSLSRSHPCRVPQEMGACSSVPLQKQLFGEEECQQQIPGRFWRP